MLHPDDPYEPWSALCRTCTASTHDEPYGVVMADALDHREDTGHDLDVLPTRHVFA